MVPLGGPLSTAEELHRCSLVCLLSSCGVAAEFVMPIIGAVDDDGVQHGNCGTMGHTCTAPDVTQQATALTLNSPCPYVSGIQLLNDHSHNRYVIEYLYSYFAVHDALVIHGGSWREKLFQQ